MTAVQEPCGWEPGSRVDNGLRYIYNRKDAEERRPPKTTARHGRVVAEGNPILPANTGTYRVISSRQSPKPYSKGEYHPQLIL